MSNMQIKRFIKEQKKNPYYIWEALGNAGALNWMSTPLFLKLQYRSKMGKKLNMKYPRTFNEKLNWLKVYDKNPLYIELVDKFEVKSWVKKIIGEEYVVKTIGVWEKFEDIDFEKLPNKFVIKCTHDSGSTKIINNDLSVNINKLREFYNLNLKKNYYYRGREWAYKYVKPRIIVEELLSDEFDEIVDYKFLCFNGIVKYIFTCTGRNTEDGLRVTFFDRKWNKLDFERHYSRNEKKISKPEKLDEMIHISEKLSENIPFVRVDLYYVNRKIYFGEMTFYPGNGMEEFTPEMADYLLGDEIDISCIR